MTNRGSSQSFVDETVKDTVQLFLMVEMRFTDDEGSDATQYLTTLPYDITHQSIVWRGAEGIADVESIEEDVRTFKGMKFKLSAVPQSAIAEALLYPVQGVKVFMYMAVNKSGTIVRDSSCWSGTLDTKKIVVGSPNSVVEVSAEHEMSRWDAANNWRFSPEDQRYLYPRTPVEDLFFDFAPEMSEKTVSWPYAAFFKK